MSSEIFLALAGGVGGARFANGLAACLPPEALTIAVNTGDDFEHMGLSVSPDIDTVMYTLAGINNATPGWGVAGETWNAMHSLKRLGGPDWFQLGDHDIATHILRTLRLKTETLSQITADFSRRLGVGPSIAPMSDDPVRSMVHTDEGVLPFQDYFVRRQCAPRFLKLELAGIEAAKPSESLIAALTDERLGAVIFCPSNPVLSLQPILSLSGVRDLLDRCGAPVIAVSPFIGGKAVKGPAGKIMAELGLPASIDGLRAAYGDLVDAYVVDEADGEAAGPDDLVTDTLMRNAADQARLAAEVIAFSRSVAPRRA